MKVITSGHVQNIPYSTTLNNELRSPADAALTRLNASLRRMTVNSNCLQKPLTEDAVVLRDKLNKEFDELFPTLFRKTRYRGVTSLSDEQYELVKKLKSGDIVKDDGFAYFSKNKTVAKKFAEGTNSVLIECKIPFGSKVSRMLFDILQFQEGALVVKTGETMLPAGSRFKVLKNSIDKKGLVKLVIKYLK